MADQRLEFEIAVTGQPVATQRVERFRDSIGSLDRAAAQVNTRLGGIAGGIGNLGTVLTRASPQMSAFAAVIGTAGSAISGLTTALGGIGGLAAGGLIGAIGLVAARMAFAKQRTDELNRAVKDATKTLGDFIAVAQRAQAARALQTRVTLGVGTAIEQQAAVDEQQARIQKLIEEREGIAEAFNRGDPGAREAAIRKNREIQAARDKLDQLQRAQQLQRVEAARAPEEQADEARVDRERQERARKAEAARKNREREAAAARRQAQADREREERGFQTLVTGLAGRGALEDTFAAFQRDVLDPRGGVFAITESDKGEALLRFEQRRKELIQERMFAEQDAQAVAIDGAQQALTAIILGEEGGARAALKATGDTLVAQGVQHGFQAAAMAIIPGMQGNAGALAGIAAAEIAAGKAMGAAFAAPAQGAQASGIRPQAVQQQAPATQTIVNINGIADRRTGEQVVESLRVVKRQRGEKAVQI